MHTVWKGSISFGLVNIPVKMFAATEDKDIRFKYIHKECHTPVKYKKMCPSCNKEVAPEDIVKGYEYEPGKYVIMTDEDFASIKASGERSVEILDFVKLQEIDPIYFDKTYYLGPQDTGSKAYTLLRDAFNKTGRIAVAKITIRDREALCVIRVYKGVLVLETIFYPDEVRDFKQVPGVPEHTNTTEAELNMAISLIDNLTTKFDPSKYKDTYRETLVELINSKVEGKEIVVRKDVEKHNVISLMDALQQSIKMSQQNKKNAQEEEEKPKKRAKKAADKQTPDNQTPDNRTPEEETKASTKAAKTKTTKKTAPKTRTKEPV